MWTQAGAIQILLCAKAQNTVPEPVTSLGFPQAEGPTSLMCLGLVWNIKPRAPRTIIEI